jgi:DNA-directed RNA polymerase alpha subunit
LKSVKESAADLRVRLARLRVEIARGGERLRYFKERRISLQQELRAAERREGAVSPAEAALEKEIAQRLKINGGRLSVRSTNCILNELPSDFAIDRRKYQIQGPNAEPLPRAVAEQVARMTKDELMRVPNCGHTSVAEIKVWLRVFHKLPLGWDGK